MNDLISRQAAIDALNQIFDRCEEIEAHLPEGDPDRTGYKMYPDYMTVWKYLHQLPSAQPEPRWIPCSESEELPEDEYVLISKRPTKISGDKWCVAIAIRTADQRSGKIQWRDSGFGIIQDDNVLAWMPLPEPYKERTK